MGKLIKFIIYAIAMCVIYIVIGSLYNRKNITGDSGQSEMCYVVKMPGTLKYVYLGLFLLGVCMFCIFTFQKIQKNPTVTDGHLWMSLGVMAIGLLVAVWANRWRVAVNGEKMEIQRLFRKNVILQVNEIERVETGKKNQMILYRGGKKLITIDYLTDNYECLEKTLKRNVREENEKSKN